MLHDGVVHARVRLALLLLQLGRVFDDIVDELRVSRKGPPEVLGMGAVLGRQLVPLSAAGMPDMPYAFQAVEALVAGESGGPCFVGVLDKALVGENAILVASEYVVEEVEPCFWSCPFGGRLWRSFGEQCPQSILPLADNSLLLAPALPFAFLWRPMILRICPPLCCN